MYTKRTSVVLEVLYLIVIKLFVVVLSNSIETFGVTQRQYNIHVLQPLAPNNNNTYNTVQYNAYFSCSFQPYKHYTMQTYVTQRNKCLSVVILSKLGSSCEN